MPRLTKSASRRRHRHPRRLAKIVATAALAGVSIAVLTREASGLSSTWTQDSFGAYDWGTLANWTNGIPQFAGDSATFAVNVPSPNAVTVYLNGDRTLSQLAIGNSAGPGGVEIAPGSGGSLILSGVGGPATVQFTSAGGFGFSHTISAPIVAATDTSFFSSIQQAQVTLSGAISGPGAVSYDNDVGGVQPAANNVAQFRVSGANSYTGGTTIHDASVIPLSDTAFGPGAVTVLAGGQVYAQNTQTFANDFTLMGGGWNDGFGLKGALRLEGSSIVNGNVTVATNATVYNDFGSAVLNGSVTGSGVLTKAGSGTVMLNGVNTLPSVSITGGTLQIGNGGTTGSFGFGPVTTSFNGTLAINRSDPITFTNGLSGTGGNFRKLGPNVVTLPGALAYTGTTYVSQGELLVTGTLNGTTGTQLYIDGTSTFTVAEAANRNQGMGNAFFFQGDGVVQSVYPGTGTTRLTFSTTNAVTNGGTANFIVSGGANGSTNGIALTGASKNAILGPAFFFGNTSFAWVDSANLLRGINYTSDAGAVRVTASTASTAGTHVQVSGNGVITAQTTAAFSTLNLANANDFTLASNATLTVGGILRSGNVSGGTINGGTLQPLTTSNLVVRADAVADTLTINSPIVANGTYGFIKSGLGTVTLNGATTYAGDTAVNAGTLRINLPGNASPFPDGRNLNVQTGATLVIDAGAHTATIGTTFISGGGAINLATTNPNGLTIGSTFTNFTGTLNIASTGAGRVIGSSFLFPAGATLNIPAGASFYGMSGTSAGTIRLVGEGNGDGFGALRMDAFSQSGPTVLLGDSTIGVNSGTAIYAPISESGGSFSLTKAGPGVLTFQGAAVLGYTGLTVVREGSLEFRTNATAPGGLQIGGPGATGNSQAQVLVTSLAIPAGKTVVVGTNAPSPFTSTLNVTGTLNNAGALTIGANSTASILGGAVNQIGPLTLRSNGAAATTLTIASGAFTYAAATPIVLDGSAGTSASGSPVLTVDNLSTFTTNQAFAATAGAGGALPTINLSNGSTLRLSADIPSLITGPAIVNLSASAVSIDTQGFSTTISAVLQDQSVFAAPLMKKGSGTLKLTAMNTFTGTTTVAAGTLIVSGGLSGKANVNGAGAVLTGSGSVGDLTLTNGTLTPGDAGISPLSTRNLTLSGGSTLFELAPNGAADRLAATGAVRFSAPVELQLAYTADLPDHTTFTLIENDGDSADPVLFENDGAFTYQGKPIVLGQDFLYVSNGFAEYFSLSYTGGDGNDITLTAVPEPSAAFSVYCGLSALLLHRWRTRRFTPRAGANCR